MRIAYVITRADAVGGATVHVRDVARAMIGRGHEAMVFVGGCGPVTEQLDAAGVPFCSLKRLSRALHPLQDAGAYFELATALRAYSPDLVSAHTAKAGWLARAACARLPVPVIYTPHGWAITDRISPAQGVVYRFAERAAARWAAAIVCVCEYERRLAIEHRIARPEQLHVIYNGVREIPARLRARPEAEPVHIVSIARLEPPKDHPTLLEALAGLKEFEWTLELIGEGPGEAQIRARVARLGLTQRVRLAGYQSDPAEALARAQIFVLSSRSEAMPRSILEAMRAGLPVVASAVGGVPEAIEDGATGLLAPRGSVSALRIALQRMISNPKERELVGSAAHLSFRGHFRLESMLEATAALYGKLVTAVGPRNFAE